MSTWLYSAGAIVTSIRYICPLILRKWQKQNIPIYTKIYRWFFFFLESAYSLAHRKMFLQRRILFCKMQLDDIISISIVAEVLFEIEMNTCSAIALQFCIHSAKAISVKMVTEREINNSICHHILPWGNSNTILFFSLWWSVKAENARR